jgi:phosphoglycolate phosphatase
MTDNLNLIFDFDGTLVDSYENVILNFAVLAEKFKFRKITLQDIEGLKDLTSKELIKYLKIPLYKLPSVLRSAKEYMQHEIPTLTTFPDLPEVLNTLYQSDVTLSILTSNSLNNVTTWLARNNMQHLFKFIHSDSSYFGKKYLLRKIITLNKLDPSKTYYVGDETRDVIAARKCHIGSIAVLWGFNSEKILSQYHPTHIARTPKDLLSIEY